MNAQLHFAFVTFVLVLPSLAHAAQAADLAKAAADACETAVAETVRNMRGRDAKEVLFTGTKRALAPAAADDDEIGVKGEGRYRGAAGGAMPFSYTCAYNVKTAATTGVMFSEKGVVRRVEEKPWQPDLTNLSPEACEAATARALKGKHPRVDRITFDSESRQLRPAPNAHASLEGRGAVVRAAGMNAVPFTYRCEFDARSDKIVGVQTSD
jgi:hypothetical protein